MKKLKAYILKHEKKKLKLFVFNIFSKKKE